MPNSQKGKSLSSILVGDELGLLKRVELHSTPSANNVVTLNRDLIKGEPTPDKSVICIRPFLTPIRIDTDDEDEDEAPTGLIRRASCPGNEAAHLFLVASKPHSLYLYNSLTNQFTPVNVPTDNEDLSLIGAQPINRSNIVVCYDNGSIFVQNIEKELLETSTESKKKAIRLLGLDLESNSDGSPPGSSGSNSAPGSAKNGKLAKGSAISGNRSKYSTGKSATSAGSDTMSTSTSSGSSHVSTSASSMFSPNWNTSSTSVGCLEVCNNRLAVAGKNLDLKVFDLLTKQCIFTAKSTNRDWLGLKHAIWVSDIDWIGPVASKSSTNLASKLYSPSMVATCSRTDSIIRIYDIKCKQRKPIWSLNLKDSTFNNDSNPPSFTSLCSTSTPQSSAVPTQQLILGTTMGRMMAVDLRFNSHSYQHLGVFKGFGGGAIRDIKFVPEAGTNVNKIISCSLDRFVRIHSFSLGSNKKRQLDSKFYMKTRPTCLQPILSSYMIADISDEMAHIDDSDFDSDEDQM